MNDDVISDLKQFITGAITQQTSDLREDINGIKQDIKRLDTKIDDLSASVAEAIDTTNKSTETRLNDHEQRIAALEPEAA